MATNTIRVSDTHGACATTLLAGCCAAVLLGGVGAASAQVLVGSRTSPFQGCTADGVASQEGVNYPEHRDRALGRRQPQPDQRNLIAGWQQDRWSNGGVARADSAGVSFDGGATWRNRADAPASPPARAAATSVRPTLG